MLDPVEQLIESVKTAKFTEDGQQVVYDASSFEKLQACHVLHDYTYRKKLIPPLKEKSPAIVWGKAWHDIREAAEYAKINGAEPSTILRDSLHVSLSKWGDALLKSRDTGRTVATLVRAAVEYSERFANDEYETAIINGVPFIEQRFEVPLFIPGKRWSGRLDRLVRLKGTDNYYIWECKSTDATLGNYFYLRYNPNHQNPSYYWALKEVMGINIIGVVMDCVQTAVGFTRFARYPITFVPSQIEEWKEEVRNEIALADSAWAEGKLRMRRTSCMNYGGCAFREVCGDAQEFRHNALLRVMNPPEYDD